MGGIWGNNRLRKFYIQIGKTAWISWWIQQEQRDMAEGRDVVKKMRPKKENRVRSGDGLEVILDHQKLASPGVPGWLSRLSVQLLISARVVISGSWDPAPHQCGICLGFSLSLCLCLSPCLHSCSPSQDK